MSRHHQPDAEPAGDPSGLAEYYRQSPEYRDMLAGQDESTFTTYVSLFRDWVPEGSRVLDVGCGVGTSTRLLRAAGYTALGTDTSKQFLPDEDGFFVAHFDGRTTLPDNAFAAVGALNVLEHVARPRAFLDEMVRVTAPGGWIVLSTPNLTSPLVGLRALLDLMQGKTPYLGTASIPDAARLFGRNVVRSVAAASGRDAFAPRAHALSTGIVGHDVDAIYWTNAAEVRRHLERSGCELVAYQTEARTPVARFVAGAMPSFAGQLTVVARVPPADGPGTAG